MKNKKIIGVILLIFSFLIISGCELQHSPPKENTIIGKINVVNTFEGRVYPIYIDDFNNPENSGLEWIINSPEGFFPLRGDNLLSLTPSSKIKVKGKLQGNTLTISDNEIITLEEGELAGPDFNLGENQILILFGEYGDTPFGHSFEEVQQNIFGSEDSIDDFYKENSYEKTWFSGDIIGPIFLGSEFPKDEDCNSINWDASQQMMEFVNPSVDFTQYKRIMFVFNFPGCGASYAGVGAFTQETPDGEVIQSWSWVQFQSDFFIGVGSHELGHNFGTYHSNFVDCGDDSFGDSFDNCEHEVYGNLFTIMGGGGKRHFTANHKHKLGWFASDDTIWTYANEWPRTISLIPLESNMEGVKEIIIPYLIFNSNDEIPFLWEYWAYYDDPIHTYYSLEYRQPIGYDVNDFYYGNLINDGVFIVFRSWPVESEPENPPLPWTLTAEHLIDTSPGNYLYMPQEDAVLLEGEEYYDNNIGIKIKVLSMNSSGAEIEIIKTKVPTWTECNTETHPEDCNDVCTDLNTTCTEECTTISGVENAGAEIFIDVDDCSLDYSYESGCFNTIPSGSSRHCCCLIESVGEPEPPTGGGKALPHQQYIGEEDSQLSKESIFTKIINIIKNILTAKIK